MAAELDRTFDDTAIHPLITHEQLERRIDELAMDIGRDYRGVSLATVTVLNGAQPFSQALRARLLRYGLRAADDTIHLSSYGSGTQSSGAVKVVKDIVADVRGKSVLVIEDIVDSGHTMRFLLGHLAAKGAADVKVCTLLNKPGRRAGEVPTHYVGFDIPDRFVLGFGLDYQEQHRELPYIGYVEV